MSNSLKIKKPALFARFLLAITRISPAAELEFTPEGCTANVYNQSRSMKAFFFTDVAVAEERTAVCLNDIKRLRLATDMIANFTDEEFCFTIEQEPSPRIVYNGIAKVEINLTNRDRMIQFIADAAKDYTHDYIATIDLAGFKMLDKIRAVVSEKAKVHLYEREGYKGLFAELDDKSDTGSSKAGMPLTLNIELGEGEFGPPLIFEFTDFESWNPLGLKTITLVRVGMNGRPLRVIRAISEVQEDNFSIACELTMASIKG